MISDRVDMQKPTGASTSPRDVRLVVNGAFRGQRVTGQQRYATEVADQLLRMPGVIEWTPSAFVQKSKLLAWLWVLMIGLRSRRAPLLSMTSRAPLFAKNHAIVIHDLFVCTHPEWYSRLYVVTHVPALRAQVRGAAFRFAVSAPVAEEVGAFFRVSVPTVSPNAPSEVFFREYPAEEIDERLAKMGLRPEAYLLSVASVDPRKNAERLVDAYIRLPPEVRNEVSLALVGGSSSLYKKSASNRQSSTDGVISLGYVTDDDLAVLYRGSAGVVFPSLDEGFGLPAVEARVSGAKLLVSDLPVFRWVCGNDGTTFCDPTSVESIRQGILEMLAGPAPSSDALPFDWEKTAATIYDACVR